MDDLVIRGGGILDGTGNDTVRGDLVIRDDRIVAITPRPAGTARREIDAQGLIVAPGFIDIKTHSDFTLPYAPGAESKILQGVTTEVIGHCGFSLAGAAGSGADPAGVSRGVCALDRDARDQLRRVHGRLLADGGQHDHAGRSQYSPP
jgi:N-acyl-D-aspartate/D-glutamate deacylase